MLFAELDLIAEELPSDGPLNMAIDEALGWCATRPVLRVYQWSEPTVSFGYFEPITLVQAAYPGLPVIRRWTGGGTVRHAADWTYSLSIPVGHPFVETAPSDSYAAIHQAVRSFLGSAGWQVELTDTCARTGDGCFQRPVLSDLVYRGAKVAGAAQRRTREFLLHQGSIQNLPVETWSAQTFATFFCKSFAHRSLCSDEQEIATGLVKTRYGTAEWANLR